MGKETYTVETQVTQYRCDECGYGYLEPTGRMLTSIPPQYPHRCSHCGAMKTFKAKYPLTAYVPVKILDEKLS